jgi:hypothetical protein
VAILIEADGEITTPQVEGTAEPDHPGGRLRHVRALIDSVVPNGVAILHVGGLVVWSDGYAHHRRRRTSMIGAVGIADAFVFLGLEPVGADIEG